MTERVALRGYDTTLDRAGLALGAGGLMGGTIASVLVALGGPPSLLGIVVGFVVGAAQGDRDRLEGPEGKEMLDRHVEIGGDLHREFEAWFVIAALEIADRLRVHAHGIGQLAARGAAFGPE